MIRSSTNRLLLARTTTTTSVLHHRALVSSLSLPKRSIYTREGCNTPHIHDNRSNYNNGYKKSTKRNFLSLRPSSWLQQQQQQQQQHLQQQGGLGAVQMQQHRSVFIQTADTPNPESLKFVPTGVPVLNNKQQQQRNDDDDGTDDDDGGVDQFQEEQVRGYYVTKSDSANDILKSPLAKKLFDVEGVKAVYLGSDFVTVTKYAEHKWKLLRPQLFDVLMNWAESGQPALLDQPLITDTTILDDDDEVVAMIKELIEARIRPAVQEDGGDIRYVSFDEETGLVTVQLAGSCVGCPSSSVTLKQGVENMLMHYIPEVTAVTALEEKEDEEGGADGGKDGGDDDRATAATKQHKTYEERLAAAGIPFSD